MVIIEWAVSCRTAPSCGCGLSQYRVFSSVLRNLSLFQTLPQRVKLPYFTCSLLVEICFRNYERASLKENPPLGRDGSRLDTSYVAANGDYRQL